MTDDDTRSRHTLVTGGCGFVMAATVRRLLELDDQAQVTVLDRWKPTERLREYLGQSLERVAFVEADVADFAALPDLDVSHVVHGATVVWSPELEPMHARSYADVNIGGTVNMLEWARKRSIRRFIHVSSGDAYGTQNRWSPRAMQDEDGPFNPRELYAISKYASEQIARRYAELFPLDVRAVRLSGVFGPMERPSGSPRIV